MDQARHLTFAVLLALVAGLATACASASGRAVSQPDRETLEREFALVRSLPKPAPDTSTFLRCGPRGSHPDQLFNLKKNRIDTAVAYTQLSLDALAALPARRSTAYRFRNLWTSGETKALAQYEGAAVMVEAYVVKVTVEMPEPTNCYGRDSTERDWHVRLGSTPEAGIMDAVVAEITPRFRALHPEWLRATLDSLVATHTRVRISGWTLYDQMHFISRRRTAWEIHPITRIETWDGVGWRVLPPPIRQVWIQLVGSFATCFWRLSMNGWTMAGAALPFVRSCLATLSRVPPWSESDADAYAFLFAE